MFASCFRNRRPGLRFIPLSKSGCAINCSRLACLHALTWQARAFNLGSCFASALGQDSGVLVCSPSSTLSSTDSESATIVRAHVAEIKNPCRSIDIGRLNLAKLLFAKNTLWNSYVQAQQHRRVVCMSQETGRRSYLRDPAASSLCLIARKLSRLQGCGHNTVLERQALANPQRILGDVSGDRQHVFAITTASRCDDSVRLLGHA